MILEPQHLGTWGLLREVRDNNFYATYIDGEPTSCPRQVIDGRWKFTIVDMTDCPVIVDGAKLAKDDTDKSKSSKISKTWVITICLGVVLLLFVVVIVGLYICMRFKRRKYDNVGWSCPPKTCTLWMEPEKGAYGLAMEIHDGNFYGLFDDDSDAWCPRYVVDSPSNFTVIDMPTCPVIVDGAMLPKDSSSPKPHNNASLKWIIPICVGFALLLLVIVIVVIYICTRK
uniref:DUF5727 domain-containing protein n=1 Tax=Panagrellus redivivus TaxID=6233 RepID=A0A7E4W2Y0_PANRE